jgi:hypothetical protein
MAGLARGNITIDARSAKDAGSVWNPARRNVWSWLLN